jgi:hypothetical protein
MKGEVYGRDLSPAGMDKKLAERWNFSSWEIKL